MGWKSHKLYYETSKWNILWLTSTKLELYVSYKHKIYVYVRMYNMSMKRNMFILFHFIFFSFLPPYSSSFPFSLDIYSSELSVINYFVLFHSIPSFLLFLTVHFLLLLLLWFMSLFCLLLHLIPLTVLVLLSFSSFICFHVPFILCWIFFLLFIAISAEFLKELNYCCDAGHFFCWPFCLFQIFFIFVDVHLTLLLLLWITLVWTLHWGRGKSLWCQGCLRKINMSIVNDNVVWGFWDLYERLNWRVFVSICNEL